MDLSLARRSDSRRQIGRVLVRLADRHGATGWGEIDLAGVDERECLTALTQRFGHALLGHEWGRPEALIDPDGPLGGAWTGAETRAAAGLDIACWDLWCRLCDTPLAHALGGTRTAVAAGGAAGKVSSVEALVDRVNQQVRGGYPRVRLDVEPGWDIEPVRAVRAAYPGLVLQADGHGRYTEEPEHLAALEALDAYRLSLIERPFAGGDLAAHARLQHRIGTPVCLPIADRETLELAARMAACSVLDLRPALAGGVTAARRLHDRAAAHGWQVWCGGGAEFGVARVVNVALASMPACTLPSDIAGGAGYDGYTYDIVKPPVRASGGMVAVPLTQPGIGHEVDEPLVRRIATRTLRLPEAVPSR